MEERLIVLSREQAKYAHKKFSFKGWRAMWKKKSVSERVFLWIMFVIFIAYGFSLLFPLIWTLINSFKPQLEYDIDSFGFPHEWTIQNYIDLAQMMSEQKTSLFAAIWNSIWMSTLSTLLGLIASSLTAYVVAKYRFKGSSVIYAVAIFIQIIPLVGAVTGMYSLIWSTLQVGDQPFLIWPMWFGGFGFAFLMLYGAFKSVPWSYAESAFIDGAGHFTTFVKVMIPQVRPVLASLFVVNFISAWGDYMTAHLYMPSYAPLALAVYILRDDATRVSVPAFLAVVTISILPTLILFICFQKLIMENTTTGGLKG
ncbi:MAG: carbohydrate ABC transporter permease [Bacilli bacterium]|nr:carbohydrate ABC transporter permease [Bacilli bacterium]